ncbi:MAG: hypothetical protein LBD12_00935 [Clostridiales Family XIII bacterium]|jgi:succinylarginine dihydrolase|nr:hypothetical protein [Clostridiales Family XIII bacterium]
MRIVSQDRTLDASYEGNSFGAVGTSVSYNGIAIGTYASERATHVVMYRMRCAYEDGEKVFRLPPAGFADGLEEVLS